MVQIGLVEGKSRFELKFFDFVWNYGDSYASWLPLFFGRMSVERLLRYSGVDSKPSPQKKRTPTTLVKVKVVLVGYFPSEVGFRQDISYDDILA